MRAEAFSAINRLAIAMCMVSSGNGLLSVDSAYSLSSIGFRAAFGHHQAVLGMTSPLIPCFGILASRWNAQSEILRRVERLEKRDRFRSVRIGRGTRLIEGA